MNISKINFSIVFESKYGGKEKVYFLCDRLLSHGMRKSCEFLIRSNYSILNLQKIYKDSNFKTKFSYLL